MAWKRHSDEDALKILREIDVHLHDGLDVVSACRKAGSGHSLRSERRTAGTKPSLAASEVMTGFANFNQRSKLVRMYKRNTYFPITFGFYHSIIIK